MLHINHEPKILQDVRADNRLDIWWTDDYVSRNRFAVERKPACAIWEFFDIAICQFQ